MLTEGVIRADDREKIFKTVLLHHNYEHHQGLFTFNSKKRRSSIHNVTPSKSELKESLSKISLRKNSAVVRKFHRSGSTVVYHPTYTGNLLCPLGAVQTEVN